MKISTVSAWLMLALSVLSAQANERFILNGPMELKVLNRGILEHVANLPAGTIIDVSSRDHLPPMRYVSDSRRILFSRSGWVRVDHFELNFRPRYGSEIEYAEDRMMRNRGYENFYISDVYLQRATPIIPDRRPVHYTTTRGNYNSYEVCYTQPRTAWVTVRDDQARVGRRNTAIGVGAAVAGILLGNSNNRDARNVGTVLTIGGAALATVGLVQISNSKDPITVYNEECRQHYVRDPQVRYVTIQNQRCTTERYYSRSWDREVEYFQTTCSSSRYYSFERHSDFWY